MKHDHKHDHESIRDRLAREPRLTYLRDWVYGGIDGSITTFAIVSGVSGAELPSRIILALGIANLVADGFSMAAGNFLSTRAEGSERTQLKRLEESHLERFPEGEREEVRQIFAKKGFSGELLEAVVAKITANKEQWVELMLIEEHNQPRRLRDPWRAGLSTFVAFCCCGAAPLIPFVLAWSDPFVSSTILTGVVFFAIGAMRSIWSTTRWWITGIESFFVGSGAALLAYWIGSSFATVAN